jgi:hypothetical protein
MTPSVISPRVLAVWFAGAIALFAAAFLVVRSKAPDPIGATTFSRSAIGYAGIADVLHRLGIRVVRSQSDTVAKVGPGALLVIAEPNFDKQRTVRQLLAAETVLLILPKWMGRPSAARPGWIDLARRLPDAGVQQVLGLVDRDARVLQRDKIAAFTANVLGAVPSLPSPTQLVRSDRLRPIVGTEEGVLVGELRTQRARLWVLTDPDVMSNQAMAVPANAVFAVALIEALRAPDASVVFDETVHGSVNPVANNPLTLLFQVPFGYATAQAIVTLLLLLWAAAGRFGAPQAPAGALRTGKRDLIENIARLLEFARHQPAIVQRYLQLTMRDLGLRLHAPSTLSSEALAGWLERLGQARGIETRSILPLNDTRALSRDLPKLVGLARELHRFKGDVIDGTWRNPGDDRKRAQGSRQGGGRPG